MRRLKKILKWTGVVLLTIIVTITVTVMLRQKIKYDRPYPTVKASTDTLVIARGKEIMLGAAHCTDCHSTYNVDSLLALGQEVPLTGGVKFEFEIGKIFSRNITPDKETGIGRYSDGEIARTLRYGVRRDGTAIFDFMPFHNMSDEDLTSVISYLRSLKPVRNKVPDNELTVMGKIVNAFLVKPVGPDGDVPVSVKRDTSAAYGKYLATYVGNCNGCHTLRDMTGAYIGTPFAGGGAFEEKGVTFFPPNLTTDSSSRIFNWTQRHFLDRFRAGKLHPKSPMPWYSFGRMSDNDLKALYNFLKSLPPAKAPVIKK
jgi:mono/diheme cytochrome c family protein